jgi:hypothetical protein
MWIFGDAFTNPSSTMYLACISLFQTRTNALASYVILIALNAVITLLDLAVNASGRHSFGIVGIFRSLDA